MQLEEKKYYRILMIILIIGMFLRIVDIYKLPNAQNVDEISSGYEAFAISNYGIDRNGNFIPAFLVAWGGGQNALLTYLIIPFIKIFGLSIFSIRLPMAILGCISLWIMFLLLKKIGNKKIAIIGLAFFAICPWHIMKSRWGLESNLFPDLILIFIYLFIKGIEEKKIWYYISFVIAGLSAYSYGTSYFFLPAFIIPLLLIFIKKRKITIKEAIIGLTITGFVAMPIVLYVIINTFDLNQINLPFMTIPKLDVNRYQEITSIFSKNFISDSISNLKTGIELMYKQMDYLPWNYLSGYGTIYIFSIVFTIIGITNTIIKDKWIKIEYEYVFNICFIVSIILMLICSPNINRVNIIWIPIIYYTIIGICVVINADKRFIISIVILYSISFSMFILEYGAENADNYFTFEGDLEEVIKYVSEIKDKQIYITNQIKEGYIHVLFYTKYNPNEFVNTVKYYNEGEEFEQVKSFGNYHFEEIRDLENSKQNVYIINKENIEDYKIDNKWVTKEFKKYIVVEGAE